MNENFTSAFTGEEIDKRLTDVPKMQTDIADTKAQVDILFTGKVDKIEGRQLSTNDYTDEDKAKLAGLANYDDAEVKAEIAAVSSQTAVNHSTLGYQRKNLLKNTAVSTTKNGVTFTVNEDGTVTVSGTATENAILTLNNINLTVGRKYTLSGCPMGGSQSTFRLSGLDTKYWSGEGTDYGSGDTFTNRNSAVQYRIVVYKGYTANNLTFYPMLRYAEITDETYEPYKPSVEERLAALEEKLAALEGGVT